MFPKRQDFIAQVCKETIPRFIASTRDCKNPWDINDGYCEEFADSFEQIMRSKHSVYLYTMVTDVISGYYFDDLDGEPSASSIAIFTAALDEISKVIDSYGTTLTLDQFFIDSPYHVFLYDDECRCYFDAELPDGSERIMDIPIMKRTLLFSLMSHTDYFQDKPEELKELVFDVTKHMLEGDAEQGDKWNSVADVIKDACAACPSLSLEVEQVIREVTAPAMVTEPLAD